MRKEFDLDPEVIYLNAGSHSICPREVLEAVTRYQREYERNPTNGLFSSWEKLWGVQTDLADFLGADPNDLFLRANVTEAMNSIILGMPMPKGGEILSTNLEYGAITNICRFRAERDGYIHRQIELSSTPEANAKLTETSLLQMIVSELKSDTRMLVISHIMTGTGLKIPLARLAKETRARGILLAVDGAHGPGAVPLSFADLGDLDFYGGNLHKWTMAAKGTGFGWVAPRHHAAIQPIFAGWTTFETREPFDVFGQGDRFQAKMLFSSSRDFAPFYALREMIAFWRRNKAAAIFARISELQDYAERAVAAQIGWPRISPPKELRGPLLTYLLPKQIGAEGYGLMGRLLQQHGLQIAMSPVVGVPQLRLSPHIWNHESEIDRAVEILKNL